MADILLTQAFDAGKKIIKMIDDAKECTTEARELSSRARATIDLLEEGTTTFEDNAHLRCNLLELKTLFEEIADVLQQCIPGSSSLSKTARRVFFSSANLKALKEQSVKLERIRRTIDERKVLVAKEQANRIEQSLVEQGKQGNRIEQSTLEQGNQFNRMAQSLLALTLTKDESPEYRLAKRLMKGKVIADKLVQDGEELGTGSFGVVVAGLYYGRQVAIKKALGMVCSQEDRENFRREAATHFALRHDRIVQVIAFSIGNDTTPPLLIMERMQGTLYSYLKTKRQSPDVPTWLKFIIDICEGLQYLHQSGVVHRDIKSPNILLDERGGAKVSDFGLAHVCSTIGRSTAKGGSAQKHNQTGTTFWMAPEVYNFGKSSFDSDIFSLHVVMWEIIEGRQGGGTVPCVGERLNTNAKAKLPLGGEDTETDPARVRLNKLVRECGLLDRKCRPNVTEILVEAKSIFDSPGVPQDAEEASMATAYPPWGSVRGQEGLPPSENRRLEQEVSSKNKGSPWQWKEIGLSCLGGDAQTDRGKNTEKITSGRDALATRALVEVRPSLNGEALLASNMYLQHGGDAARTAIMIYNATGSAMRFRLNHDIHGSVKTAFPKTIDNGKWGLALHVKQQWSLYGSEGYAVYTVHNGAGQTCDVCFCFMTPFRGDRAVYVEARGGGYWDNKKHAEAMTRLLNENRGKSDDLDHEGVVVAGTVAYSPNRPCQFIVGLQGLDMPAPWS